MVFPGYFSQREEVAISIENSPTTISLTEITKHPINSVRIEKCKVIDIPINYDGLIELIDCDLSGLNKQELKLFIYNNSHRLSNGGV